MRKPKNQVAPILRLHADGGLCKHLMGRNGTAIEGQDCPGVHMFKATCGCGCGWFAENPDRTWVVIQKSNYMSRHPRIIKVTEVTDERRRG